jgi:signal transduction histidine kinase
VRDLVREIAVQLARNAVAHGIESPATRAASGKDVKGRVDVQLVRNETDWTLSVRDDGCGACQPQPGARTPDRAGLVHGHAA